MKKLVPIFGMVTIHGLLVGCGGTPLNQPYQRPAPIGSQPSATANRQVQQTRPEPTAADPQIRVGMTKAQVIAAWGEPSGRQVSGSGEIWSWGGQRWKRMIPYAGPFLNVQTAKVIFGTNGRVKDFRLTDRGDMMTDIEGMTPGHMPW